MKALVIAIVCVCPFLLPNAPVAFADLITLTTGETMDGTIISETGAQVRLQMANEKRTIFFTRVIAKSDIKSITRDTPEQKAERAAYSALDKHKLYPSQELTTGQYKQGIDGFEKFLASYPSSTHADEIRNKLAQWNSEAANLQNGKVKFANTWMIPQEKNLRSLQSQLATLQQQRDSLFVSVNQQRAELDALQQNLVPYMSRGIYGDGTYVGDQRVPIFDQRDDGSPQHYSRPVEIGYKIVPNADRVRLQEQILATQKGIGSGEATLTILNAKIPTLETQLAEAQRAYGPAVTNTK